MKIYLIIFLLVLLFANGCMNTRIDAELPMIYPNETIDGCDTFLVPIQINSKEYLFFVDTGASCTTIDSDLKPLMGEYINTRDPNYSFHEQPLEFYKIKRPFKIDRIKLKGKVACCDIERLAPGCNVDGILGQDIMEKYIVQIDFSNKLFRLIKELSSNDNIKKQWGFRVPLTRDTHGFIYIKLNLQNGLEENFVLDSGIWGHGLLSEELFELLTGKYNLPEIYSNEYRCVALPKVFIDECEVSDLGFVAYPESKLPIGVSMLGTQFFSRFKMVTIDLSNEEIYLIPK